MAISLTKHSLKQAGFTLIEVLIALAIVGIALTAVIKATSENIRATAYLQNKTQAMWAGQYVLNAVRTGLIKLDTSDQHKEALEVLGTTWYWQADQEESANRRIKKIAVHIYKNDDDDDAAPFMTLESFIYRKES